MSIKEKTNCKRTMIVPCLWVSTCIMYMWNVQMASYGELTKGFKMFVRFDRYRHL